MSDTSPHDGQTERCEAVVAGLSKLLADTYTLGLKTQSYHWNVTGPMFQVHHQLFESQFDELAGAVDQLAERIRALDAPAPASYREYIQLTQIADDVDQPSATAMLRRLLFAHDLVAQSAQSLLTLAEDAGDASTADLATQRLQSHQQAGWILRSHLSP